MTHGHRHGRLDQHDPAPPRRRLRGRRAVHPRRHRPPVAARAAPLQGLAVHADVPHGGRAPGGRRHGHPGRDRPRRPARHDDAERARRDARRDARPLGRARAPATSVAATSTAPRPARVPSLRAFSQDAHYETLDLDRAAGCIRDVAHAYSQDGGLAVLHGNLAREGCIVKTAGVDPSLLTFRGRARVFESENDTADGIQGGAVKPGDVVVVRYEGPRGGPGMQEMLMPTSLSRRWGWPASCALVTDGRFSGATSGLSRRARLAGGRGGRRDRPRRGRRRDRHRHPEADDHAGRGRRRARAPPRGHAHARRRGVDAARAQAQVSRALRAYAALARSASHGAVRDPALVETPARPA